MLKKFLVALALSTSVVSAATEFRDENLVKNAAAHQLAIKLNSQQGKWWKDFTNAVSKDPNLRATNYVKNLAASDPKGALWFYSTGGATGFANRKATELERQELVDGQATMITKFCEQGPQYGLKAFSEMAESIGEEHLQRLTQTKNEFQLQIERLNGEVKGLNSNIKSLESRIARKDALLDKEKEDRKSDVTRLEALFNQERLDRQADVTRLEALFRQERLDRQADVARLEAKLEAAERRRVVEAEVAEARYEAERKERIAAEARIFEEMEKNRKDRIASETRIFEEMEKNRKFMESMFVRLDAQEKSANEVRCLLEKKIEEAQKKEEKLKEEHQKREEEEARKRGAAAQAAQEKIEAAQKAAQDLSLTMADQYREKEEAMANAVRAQNVQIAFLYGRLGVETSSQSSDTPTH